MSGNAGNVIGGHKATLNNPSSANSSDVSDGAKQHSRDVLDNEFDGGKIPENKVEKNPGNVIGGLKATTKNPNVSDEAKENAQERLRNEYGQ
ncbi:hypothetical protein MMC31_003977 [Peltigera leucophlebia]|nr:hypothetical protein [Peltigera leucophlebia]